MADGTNIATGIAAFLGGFASGAARQHVANTLESRKKAMAFQFENIQKAIDTGDVGFVASKESQSLLSSLLGSEKAKQAIERAKTNSPEAKIAGLLSGLTGMSRGGITVPGVGQPTRRSTESTAAASTPTPTPTPSPTSDPNAEAFRSLVAPPTAEEEAASMSMVPGAEVAPASVPTPTPTPAPTPAPMAPRAALRPTPTGRASVSIDPTTGKSSISLQPLGPEDLKAQSSDLINQMFLRGDSPQQILEEHAQRGLPPNEKEIQDRGTKRWQAAFDALRSALTDAKAKSRDPNISRATDEDIVLTAMEGASRAVGREYIPDKAFEFILSSSQLPPDIRIRLQAMQQKNAAAGATTPSLGDVLTEKEITEPAARAKAVEEAQYAAKKGQRLSGEDMALMVDPVTGERPTTKMTYGEAEQKGLIRLTTDEANTFRELGGARGMVDVMKGIQKRQFSKTENIGQAMKRGALLALAADLGHASPGSGFTDQDVKDAIDIRLIQVNSQLLARALAQKGNMTEGEQARAGKSAFSFTETRISSSAKYEFLNDMLARSGGRLGGITTTQQSQGTNLKDIAASVTSNKTLRTEPQILNFLVKSGHAPNEKGAKQLLGAMEGAGFLKFK